MKKILITGAAGQIGSSLAKRLFKEGNKLILIDNLSHGYIENLIENNNIISHCYPLDIRSKEIEPLFHEVDCAFHLAAVSSLPECQNDPMEAISINVAGTANVLECARRNKVKKVIFASTSAVYENNTAFPCSEDDYVNPSLMYSLSKLQSEELCKSFITNYGMNIIITRYYNVYGPTQDLKRPNPPFMGYAIKECLANRQPFFYSDGEQKRDYVYIDDVNDLNIIAMNIEEDINTTVNVASGISYSVRELYSIIKTLCEKSKEPIYSGANQIWDRYPNLKMGYSLRENVVEKEVNKFTLGSVKKGKDIFNWQAKTSIEEGIRKTIEVLKNGI